MSHIFKNKAKILAVAAVMLTAAVSESAAQSKYKDQYMMPDPQTWGFIKYGGQTPDLYTGTVRAEIPVYTYNDPDFDIPISLSYASNGYMPNVQANFVGLGWILNAGGCVSRKVQGIPDEGWATPPPGTIGLEVQGWLEYAGHDHSTYPVLSRPAAFSDMYCYKEDVDGHEKVFETEPDIYTFNFLGHSGKFVIGDDGEAVVYDSNHPAGEYKVDMSEMHGYSFPIDGLSITTGDGYRYDFGCLEGNPGRASQYTKTNAPTSDTFDNFGNSWVLRQITAPNGRTVTFNYSVRGEFDMRNVRPFGESSTWHRVGAPIDEMSELSGTFAGYTQSDSYILWEQHRIPRLESIDIDGKCEISFTYGQRTKEKNFDNVELATPPRLSKITVTDVVNDRVLRECILDHRYSAQSGNPVMMLLRVRIEGLGAYEMHYYHEGDAFPKHGCTAIDHWGYYNSNPGTTLGSLLPDVQVDEVTYAETVVGTSRNPDPEKAIYGMLSKITYPTGGYTEFEYEPHGYSKIVTRDHTSNYILPYLKTLDSTCVAGGLRLHRITDTAGDGVSSVRTYIYDDNGRSTGTMLNFPRYSELVRLSDTNVYQSGNAHSMTLPSCTMDNTHIGYSKVTECYADGSSMSTGFTDWSDYPDIKGDNTMTNHLSLVDWCDINFPFVEYPSFYYFQDPQSMDILRGRLKERCHYSTDGTLLRRETVNYYGSATDNYNVVKDVRICYGFAYVHNNYVGNSLESSLTLVDYDSSGASVHSASRTNSYSYNDLCQKASETVTDERGFDNTRRWYYLSDLSTRTATENAMIQANMVNGPVYELSLMNPHGAQADSTRVVSAVHNSYATFLVGGKTYYKLAQNSSASVPQGYVYTGGYAGLNYRANYTVDSYSIYGRPLSIVDNAGITTTIQWDSNGMYPLSVTSGGATTSWTYIPYVGVSSRTDPDGRTTGFNYDMYGRLISVTRPDGNTAVEYIYNIQNINE